jgi:gliding motility-associated-like protein
VGSVLYGDSWIYGFSDGSFTVNISGGLGTINFVFTDDQGNQVNQGNTNTANSLNSGWYYINVSDDICSFNDSVFIDQPDQMIFDVDITDVLCNGDTTGSAEVVNIQNFTGDFNAISYYWNPANSLGNGIGADSIGGVAAGNYTILINDENGCSETVDFTIEEPTALSFADLGFEPAQCRQYSYQNGNGVVFAAGTGGTPDYTYEWLDVYNLNTSTNSTWGGRNPSLYKITVTDGAGCILEGFIQLDSLSPVADFEMTSPQFLTQGVDEGTADVAVHFVNQSLYFSNELDPSADTTFHWNFDLGAGWELSTSYFEEFDRVYSDSGTYEICLIAYNKNGCSDTACKNILVFEKPELTLPNVFTPGNEDGANDEFFFPNAAIIELEAIVVNRWGITVFEFTDVNDKWNGTDKSGSECPDGVYFYTYKARATNGTEFEGQGNVHLIRN